MDKTKSKQPSADDVDVKTGSKHKEGSTIRQNVLDSEEVIDVDDIQADIVLGMNKPRQLVIVLDFDIHSDNKDGDEKDDKNRKNNINLIREWLTEKVLPNVSTLRDLIDERKRYRSSKSPNTSKVFFTFSLSYDALKLLTKNTQLEDSMSLFPQFGAFAVGATDRSTFLGDPIKGIGSKNKWKFGGKHNNHCVINLASDIIDNDNNNGYSLIEKFRDDTLSLNDKKYKNLFKIIDSERGDRGIPNTLLYGHEQFGFKDGLSQPESKGKYQIKNDDVKSDDNDSDSTSSDKYDFIVKRTLSPEDARYSEYSKPGFRLIDPGNFLLGYGNTGDEKNIYFPGWAKGSSYMVYRRLAQDVSGFWNDCLSEANRFIKKNKDKIKAESLPNVRKLAGFFGAKLIGRFWDGTPLIFGAPFARYLPPNDENFKENHATLVFKNLIDGKQNGFSFAEETDKWKVKLSNKQTVNIGYINNANYPADIGSGRPPNANIPSGKGYVQCPFAGHIRKIQPRDISTDIGGPEETLKHRMVRRAINYGDRIENIFKPDKKERGLLFITYQTSIENQFEFLQRHWANSDIRPKTSETGQTSDDMIIGQPSLQKDGTLLRKLSFQVALPLLPVRKKAFTDKDAKKIEQEVFDFTFESKNIRYVFAEGAGYFLTLPKSGLRMLARNKNNNKNNHNNNKNNNDTQAIQTARLVNPSFFILNKNTNFAKMNNLSLAKHKSVKIRKNKANKANKANKNSNDDASSDLFYLTPGNIKDVENNEDFYKLWNRQMQDYYWTYLCGPDALDSGVRYNQGVCYRLPEKDFRAMAKVYNESYEKYGYLVNESPCNLQFRSTQEIYTIAENKGLDIARVIISWQAFPKRVKEKYPNNFLEACKNVEILGWDPDHTITNPIGRQMDEYCEWFTYRDEKTNKIKKICITCEPPEYYDFLFMNAPDTLLKLYHKHVSKDVTLVDLTDFNNKQGDENRRVYNAYNKWNTTHGIMHLNCPPNALSAEIYIAAEAALLWKNRRGKILSGAQELINCGQYGRSTRSSDPTIGFEVNGLIRDKGYIVSIENPNGLYLQDLDTSGWLKPDKTSFTQNEIDEIVTYVRGNYKFEVDGSKFTAHSRIEIEIPEKYPFDLGDVLIGGVPVMYAGQIIDASCTMFLVGIAINPSGTKLLKPDTNPDAAVVCKNLWDPEKNIGPPIVDKPLVAEPPELEN